MSQCDGVILVYSVLEEASFTAACELRNRLFQIRSNMAKKESAMKPKSSIFAQLHQFCCGNAVEQDVKVPPLYLVGTHAVSFDFWLYSTCNEMVRVSLKSPDEMRKLEDCVLMYFFNRYRGLLPEVKSFRIVAVTTDNTCSQSYTNVTSLFRINTHFFYFRMYASKKCCMKNHHVIMTSTSSIQKRTSLLGDQWKSAKSAKPWLPVDHQSSPTTCFRLLANGRNARVSQR